MCRRVTQGVPAIRAEMVHRMRRNGARSAVTWRKMRRKVAQSAPPKPERRGLSFCNEATIAAAQRANCDGLCVDDPWAAADASWRAPARDALAHRAGDGGRGTEINRLVVAAVAAVGGIVCAPAAHGND